MSESTSRLSSVARINTTRDASEANLQTTIAIGMEDGFQQALDRLEAGLARAA